MNNRTLTLICAKECNFWVLREIVFLNCSENQGYQQKTTNKILIYHFGS